MSTEHTESQRHGEKRQKNFRRVRTGIVFPAVDEAEFGRLRPALRLRPHACAPHSSGVILRLAFSDSARGPDNLGEDVPITELLAAWKGGDRSALDRLIPLVYTNLRRIAASYLRTQPAARTIDPTALVHEAYLRLAEEQPLQLCNRAHFVGVAAQLMHWILVDYERKRRAAKRGAGVTVLSLDPSLAPAGPKPPIRKQPGT